MQVNLREFLNDADIKESLYPGKRIVKSCKQIGEYKNHCVVIDWRNPETIKIDIKPGLSGKYLTPEILKKYPVCFQSATYVEIEVTNDNDDTEEEDEEDKSTGKSGGGGKKPATKKDLEDIDLIAASFGKRAEGSIPKSGEIKEMMIMGIQIAKKAFGSAFKELTKQINHAKVTATEILAKSMDMVTRVSPPSYLKPKGNETITYDYDRDKNADIGFKMSLN